MDQFLISKSTDLDLSNDVHGKTQQISMLSTYRYIRIQAGTSNQRPIFRTIQVVGKILRINIPSKLMFTVAFPRNSSLVDNKLLATSCHFVPNHTVQREGTPAIVLVYNYLYPIGKCRSLLAIACHFYFSHICTTRC